MRNKYFHLTAAFAFLLFITGYSQYNKDSLLKIILQNKEDADAIQALILFGESIENNFIDSAMGYYNKARQLSVKTPSINNKMLLYRAQIYGFTKKGIHDSALELTNQFLIEAEKSGNKKYIANACASAGTLYGAVNQNDLSLDFYLKATELFTGLNDTVALAQLYGNISTVYADQDQHKSSVKYAEKSLALAFKLKDTFSIIQAYTNMHNSFGWLDSAALEEKYMRLSLKLGEESSGDYLRMQVFGYFAHWLAENEKYDSAIQYARKQYVIAKKHNYFTEQSESKAIEAWSLIEKKEYAKATTALYEAKNIINEKKNIPLLDRLFLLDIEYDLLKAQGKYKEALEVKEQWTELNSKMKNSEINAKMVFYNNRIYQAEIDRKLAEKQVKINRQKNLIRLLSVSAAALLLSGLLFYLYLHKKQDAKNKELLVRQKEQEFNTARASLEGQLKERTRISKEIHDELGSSLTSISLLTEVLKKRLDTHSNPEIVKISDTSADMVDKMNEIIWALNTGNDTLGSLVAYTRKFVNNFLADAGIELVYEEKNISQEKPIESIARRNVYLTVKEAVNNIVKHSGAAQVRMSVDAANDLKIEIEDNGPGIDFEKLPPFKNGLANMKKRMEDIGGKFSIENNNGVLIKLSC